MMLSNNKGVALIVLIVAMTLIAILGTSFVSLMGSKQKSFVYQIDSYRALNLANAGVEYMVRYANDETLSYGSTFFSSAQPFDLPTKQLSFSGGATGTFSARYVFNQSIGSDVLTVTGAFGNATRQVKLNRFRYYAFENITRVPGNLPVHTTGSNSVFVPLINNPDRNGSDRIRLNGVNLFIAFSSGSTKHLKEIWFDSLKVFDYSSVSDDCSISPTSNPCVDGSSGVRIPNITSVPLTISPYYPFDINNVQQCIFVFDEASIGGNFNITYSGSTYNGGTYLGIGTSIVVFVAPV